MLVIRLQRTGRKGHAMFRVIVQDSRRTPTSGKVVAWLGSYDPHQKTLKINNEKTQFYLDHGAQPSQRISLLLKEKSEVKLPKWINLIADKKRAVRNVEKRRSTRPKEAEKPAEAEVKPDTEEIKEEKPATAEVKDEPTAKPEKESETEEKADETPKASESTTEKEDKPTPEAPAVEQATEATNKE